MTAPPPLLLGAVASGLVALGGVGVGALPRRPGGIVDPVADALGLGVLRTTGAGRALCTVAVFAGVGLLLLAWSWLRREPADVLRATAVWSLPLLVCPPLFSRDAYAYAAQSALVAHGLDPYTVGPAALPGALADSVAAQYAAAPAPYGPAFLAPAARLVELVGERPVPAVLGVRLLALLGLLLLAWGLPRLAAALGRPAGPALWLGLANPLVLLHGLAGAHNDVLMAGLGVAGLAVATLPGRWPLAAGACLLTAGGLVKAPVLAGLAFLPLLPTGWRPVPTGRRLLPAGLVVAGSAAVTAVALTAASGLTWGWVRAVADGVAGPNLFSPVYGTSRLLANVTGADRTRVLHACTRAAFTLALAAGGALLLRARALGPVRALGLGLVTLVLLAPAVQPWYLLWGLPLLAAAGGPRTGRALAAASAVLCLLVLPSGSPLLHGPTWGLPVLLALAAAVRAGRPLPALSRWRP